MFDSSKPRGLQPTRLLCPWDFPGKSTGVGCHCLLWMEWGGGHFHEEQMKNPWGKVVMPWAGPGCPGLPLPVSPSTTLPPREQGLAGLPTCPEPVPCASWPCAGPWVWGLSSHRGQDSFYLTSLSLSFLICKMGIP